MKKYIKTFVIFIVFFRLNLFSQQQAGDKEIGIAGTLYRSIGGDMTMAHASVQGKIGLYLTDNFELGASPILSWSYTSYTRTEYTTEILKYPPYYRNVQKIVTYTNDETTFGAGIFATYSFLLSTTTVPYFGAQFYKDNFKDKEDKGSAGINAGFKYFISRNAAWDLGLNYLFSLNDKTEGSAEGFLLLQIGISFLF